MDSNPYAPAPTDPLALGPVEPGVGGWVDGTWRALQLHAGQLVAPGLFGWLASMLVTMPFVVIFMFVGMAVPLAGNNRDLLPVVFSAFGLVWLLLVGLLVLLNGVILHAVHRWCLALLRGEKPQPSLLWSNLGQGFGAGLVLLARGFASGFGALFCLVPGWYFATALAMAPVAYADRHEGVGAALSRSWELTEGRRLSLFLFDLVLALGVVVVALVPLVGALAMYPVMGMAQAVVYESLRTSRGET